VLKTLGSGCVSRGRDWTLAIRKREQKRLEEAAHKKRLAAPSKLDQIKRLDEQLRSRIAEMAPSTNC